MTCPPGNSPFSALLARSFTAVPTCFKVEASTKLASTLKQVGTTVKDISNKAEKGEFPGGQVIVYSLKDKGVDLAVTNLSEEGKKAVEDAKAKILDGSIKVPEK